MEKFQNESLLNYEKGFKMCLYFEQKTLKVLTHMSVSGTKLDIY